MSMKEVGFYETSRTEPSHSFRNHPRKSWSEFILGTKHFIFTAFESIVFLPRLHTPPLCCVCVVWLVLLQGDAILLVLVSIQGSVCDNVPSV